MESKLLGNISQTLEKRAEGLLGSMLDSSALAAVARESGGLAKWMGKNAGFVLAALNMPTRADVDKINEVLTRSRRKVASVEALLARFEAALSGARAIHESPLRQAAPAAKPDARPAASKERPAYTKPLIKEMFRKGGARKKPAPVAVRKAPKKPTLRGFKSMPRNPQSEIRNPKSAASILLDIDLSRRPAGARKKR